MFLLYIKQNVGQIRNIFAKKVCKHLRYTIFLFIFKLYSILEENLKINIHLKSHFDLNDNSPVNETLLFIDLK